MKEKLTLKVKCPRCGFERFTSIFKGFPKGKRIECFGCGKKYVYHKDVNNTNIIGRKK